MGCQPPCLISDRGPQFNNNFWAHACELLGMDKRMSSAFHPQTDGQTERTNRTLEEMLRAYISLEHDVGMLSWCVLSSQSTTPGRKP
jgi:transposase InsO family protein